MIQRKSSSNSSSSNNTITQNHHYVRQFGFSFVVAVVLLLCTCTNGFIISHTIEHKRHVSLQPQSKRMSVSNELPSVTTARYMFNGNSGNSNNSRDETVTSSTSSSTSSMSNNNKISGGIAGGLQLQTLQKSNSNNSVAISNMNSILDQLEKSNDNDLELPYTFELKKQQNIFSTTTKGTNTKQTKLRVRQMEMKDLPRCVSMCLEEYGKYASPQDSNSLLSKLGLQSKFDDLDNFVFSFVVLLGLEQRVSRRMQSDASKTLPQDHNVVVLSEIKTKQKVNDNGTYSSSTEEEEEVIFGMAEISLQPPNPSRTSPPFVIPTNIKNMLSDPSSILNSVLSPSSSPSPSLTTTTTTITNNNNNKNKNNQKLCAYVSNVLITSKYRSKGYSKLLMSTCHGIAKKWGYKSVFLHVDADANAGRAAQQLYRKLGYKPFVTDAYNEQFAWMGIDLKNRGLYIVDGVPLLFLKKDL